MKRAGLIGLLAVLLIGAVALIVYGETRPLERTFHGSVKNLLPKLEEIPGWSMQYLPIADTPEVQAKVNELLNYDDAVYAVYTKGTERVSIYIAYWTPGKMSQRLIAGHTPDVCWVGSGWKILQAESGNSEKPKAEVGREGLNPGARKFRDLTLESSAPAVRLFSTLESEISGFDVGRGERRLMELRGHTELVAFWHLSGGTIVSYGVGTPKWHAALEEALDAFQQRGEQLFIRISTDAGR